MARQRRIEKIGFYHIINRGVERRTIYLDDEDHIKFLEIMEDSAEIYSFTIHSYCLMNNHYHLLLQTDTENLSLIMRQINSRYSIYFNNKYDRVGPLWQGRFKSWYIYDVTYLSSLIKYIEFNPVKAKMVQKTGQYRWSMSSKQDLLECSNYALINKINFDKEPDEKELNQVDKIFTLKLEIEDDVVVQKVKKDISEYFDGATREVAIAHALRRGHTQREVGAYLQLSNIAISKIYRIYKQKVQLFNKLRDKGVFWSYSKDIVYDKAGRELLIEYLLKYGDFDDIKLGFQLFGKRVVKRAWEEQLKSDKRFIKLNLMIARVFLGMDVESNYFKEVRNARLEKLRVLAS